MDLLGGRTFRVASYGVAAAYTAWLLRQFGADVEHETALDPEGVGAFLGQDATFSGRPGLGTGVRALITDAPVTDANRTEIEELAESQAVTWITPWGLDAPEPGAPWSDLTLHAAGGWMAAVGEPGREPLGPTGAQGQFVAGLFAAIAALDAREPGLADVPMVQAVTATMIYDVVGYQYNGVVRRRVGNRFTFANSLLVTLPCADGFAGIHAALHPQFVKLTEVIGHPEMVSDPRFAEPLTRAGHAAEMDVLIDEWLGSKSRWDAFHELQRAGIPASGTPTMAEVLDSPQLRARKSWERVTTPSGRELKVPGAPARVMAVADGKPKERADGPWKPGALRVLDVSMGWAGPMVPHILAGFGADVIKVESHTRFDWWRGSRPPGGDSSLALHERSHVFNTVNRGKRGLTLNFTTARGRELAMELFASADLVVENFGAGVMEKLGFGWEQLSAANPGLILLRQPGFGSTGPEAGYRVFGNTIEGMSGLTGLMGYSDESVPIMMSNACGDPVSGLNGTIAVMAALEARSRDGKGRYIEAAQLEGFLPLVSEALISSQLTGKQPSRKGNAREGHAVSGAFRCADEDSWVVVSARDERELRALEATTGNCSGEGIERWTRERTKEDSAAALIAAGVAAAAVNREPDLLASPLHEGFWAGLEREPNGYHLYPTLPIVRGGSHIEPTLAAPHLGEHNAEILAGLGLSGEEIEELVLEDVIGTVPR